MTAPGKVRAVAAAGATLALLFASRTGDAHVVPAQRSVLVQAEKSSVAILVTWTSSNTGGAEELLAEAIAGRRGGRAHKSLRAFVAARALAPVKLLVDGKPLSIENLSTKVVLDPNNTGRLGAAVLITANLPGDGANLLVRVAPGQGRTRLTWIDKSRGAVSAARPAKPGEWTVLSSLSLTWK